MKNCDFNTSSLKTTTILSLEKNIEVSFSDTDAMQIVWHGNYVRYFEEAREQFGKKYGLGYLDFYLDGFLTPIIDIQISYKRMIQYGEKVRVLITYKPTRALKIVFEYQIFNENYDLVCEGSTSQVLTTLEKDLVFKVPSIIQNFNSIWLNNNNTI